jgi:uncharacterized protein (TIGR03435 family)
MNFERDEFETLLKRFRLRKPRPLPEMLPARRRLPILPWLIPAAAVVLLAFVAIYVSRQVQTVPAAAAVVQSIGGDFNRVSGAVLHSGEMLGLGEGVRTGGGLGGILALNDGSRIEIRAHSVLSLDRADDGIRINLYSGGVIVTATKQRTGHLYVQTKDLSVSVVGTVFLVNAEEAGSRVAVIEGEVQVRQGTMEKKLLPGEQTATNPLMDSPPLPEEISWSGHVEEHVALLQQSIEPATAAAKPQQFEVVSIKAAVGGRPTRVRCKGTDGELDVAPAGSAPPPVPQGRCVAASVPLPALVAAAYDIPLERVSGFEGAAAQTAYQIDAKAEDPSSATRDQLRQMLQSALADRLKLKVHREFKEGDGYVLSVAKGGVKFKEFSGDEENTPLGPPNVLPRIIPLRGKFRMRRLASSLSTFVGRLPVIDKTELRAVYNIDLVLTPVPNLPSDADRLRSAGAALSGRGSPARMEFDPSLTKAIEEQLGLRFEPAKVPIEYLIVDHVEKAIEN